MDREEENRIIWAFFVIFIAIIVVSLLWGCKTQKVVETQVLTIHDTLITHRTDTVRDVKVTTKTDTIKQIESHTYTLNNVGDTVREIHHYHDLWHTLVVDSTDRYKVVVDSLRSALHEEQGKNKTVTKYKPIIRWWEYVVLLAIVGITIFFVLKRGGKTFIDKI
jgi:hypothetical protein